jgi:phospholipase C
MKGAAISFCGLLLIATAAHAQAPTNPQGKVQHVIVVIQENRTVDNLFGSSPAFEKGGLNIASSGYGYVNNVRTQITLQPEVLYSCYDINHTHADFLHLYDSGNLDGGNSETFNDPAGCILPTNPAYMYADNSNSTNPANEVQPYIDIAKQFGFANYMFQTNQGPSFPAHQFLFSGTSAPIYNDGDSNQYWTWFGAENPKTAGGGTATGCLGEVTPNLNNVLELDPNSDPESSGWSNPALFSGTSGAGYPCYNHNTIANVLDPAGISWKYYTNDPTSLWTAPNAIQAICNPSAAGQPCSIATGSDWLNVIKSSTTNGHPAQILEDIRSCSLAKVSFVTPDGAWSDHAGCATGNNCNTAAYGPSWVAAIVNGIGGGMTGSTCNTSTNPYYWNNTVIFVVWDDWGGWYDHVLPPKPNGYAGNSGNGQQYVYGLRVPLLVVSAYSYKQGYISGAASSNSVNACPISPNTKYCHDFGSILNFIEYAFGSNNKSLGEIYSSYHYADYYAWDGPNVCGIQCPYSLSDFFNFNASPSSFTAISAPYGASTFLDWTGNPQPPDNDGDD